MNSGNLQFGADYLFDGERLWRDRVLVTDRGGTVLEILPKEEEGDGVRRVEGILCPGFVNAHCHLELSHMRGIIPEGTGLVHFLLAVMAQRNRPSEEIQEAARAAEEEMRGEGIAAVGDISNTADTLALKAAGRLYYLSFVETLGLKPADAAARMDRAAALAAQFRGRGLEAAVVPHAPYSVSPPLLTLVNAATGPEDILSIHNQESVEENRLFEGAESGFYRLFDALGMPASAFSPTGVSSLRSWLPAFTGSQPLILVHNTYTDREDVRFAAGSTHTVFWCLCPGANRYIETRMPPVEMLMEEGARIVLGTDSLASNHRLSILEEIRLLAAHFPAISLETLLGWATSAGAEALGIAGRFGRFRPGTSPGLVQLFPLDIAGGSPRITRATRAVRLR